MYIYIQETNKPGRNFSYQLRHLKIQKNEVLDSKVQETKNEKVKKKKKGDKSVHIVLLQQLILPERKRKFLTLLCR